MRLSHSFRNAYELSPKTVRLVVGAALSKIPNNFKYGTSFSKTAKSLKFMINDNNEDLMKAQFQKLRSILVLADKKVPYYRSLFKEIDFNPEQITDMDDLQKIPLLTRDLVNKLDKNLLVEGLPNNYYRYTTTAGTSGKPLGFYISHDASAIEWAFMNWNWSFAGFKEFDKRAVLRGRVFKSNTKDLWEADLLQNAIYFSSFNMNSSNLTKYVKKMNDYKPLFLHAYPSTAIIFAQHLRINNLEIPSIQGLLLGSENLHSSQKKYLEEVFKCRVYSWYGHSEKCVLAGNCDMNESYWPFPYYGYTELIDNDGKIINDIGVVGRIVGTSFINKATLFVRYLTDDEAEWGLENVNGISRKVLKKIVGRWNQEILIGKTGSRIPITAINLHSEIYTKVKKLQFFQESPGVVTLKIVPSISWNKDDENKLLNEFNERLSTEIDLKIKLVESILLSKSGKYKFIDQRIILENEGGY